MEVIASNRSRSDSGNGFEASMQMHGTSGPMAFRRRSAPPTRLEGNRLLTARANSPRPHGMSSSSSLSSAPKDDWSRESTARFTPRWVLPRGTGCASSAVTVPTYRRPFTSANRLIGGPTPHGRVVPGDLRA